MINNIENTLQRGFVTIATGHSKYYQMALNLLLSYRAYGKCPYPFAIICDRVCAETQKFDDIVLIKNPTCSFMDKLVLPDYAPYDETIFIDADCLILRDVNILWDELAPRDDFCCYGRFLPLESREGWFYYKDMGLLQSQIKHGISMHGGVYFLRKSERCRLFFDKAREIAEEYDKYVFYHFKRPADEPVLALALVLLDGNPCPVTVSDRIAVIPGLNEGRFRFSLRGECFFDNKPCSAAIIHIGSRGVKRFMYRYWLGNVENKLLDSSYKPTALQYCIFKVSCVPAEVKYTLKRFAYKKLPKGLQQFLKTYLPSRLMNLIKK